MIKPLLKSLIFFFLLLPLAGFCQLPFPKWVNDLGGSGDSKPTGMVSDSQGNVYVSGYFSGTVDFDPSAAGVKNLNSVGGYDIYIAKYNVSGTLIWATSMGGSDLDQVNAMGIDANGNPTIIGQFRSSNLQAGGTTLQTTGDEDIFIIHLNTNGSVVWAKSIGGSSTDRGEQASSDAQGNVIATTIFQNTISIGGHTESALTGFNALIIKYDAAGKFIWDINLGGTSGDTQVYGNSTDSNGNIVVSGSFSGSIDFDPLGIHKFSPNNGSNVPFIAKYSPAGKLIWVNYIGGNFINNGSALSIDGSDNIYLTGSFSGSLSFGTGNNINTTGSQDTFLAKYLANGTISFAKDIGGSGASAFNYMIRNDKNNSVYITGYFSGTMDFDPSVAVANVSYHGQRDFYLAKYDLNGNYQWAFSGGSPNCNVTFGIEIAVINVDDVVLGGSFCSTVNFDPSSCTIANYTAQNSTSDTFVARYVQGSSAISQLTNLAIPQQLAPSIIDQAKLTVTVVMPPNTNITALLPAITTTAGTTISPASGTAQNFTNPVSYTVNGGCKPATYKVTVVVAKASLTCSGASNVLAGDTPTPAGNYAWQVLQGNTWANAAGTVNTQNYETSVLVNSTQANIVFNLRRQITSGTITYDSYHQVTVQPNVAIANNNVAAPAVTAFCGTGDPATITGSTPTGGSGAFTYQWQSSADGTNYINLTGTNNKDYDPAAISATTYYRRVTSSGTCNAPIISNSIQITITPAIANNSISAPTVTSFCAAGNPAIILGSTATGGNGIYQYQWQASADNATFSNIIGATGKDYDPAAISATVYYRRSVISGVCSTPVISNVIPFIILAVPANAVLTPATPVCAGSQAALSVSSPINGLTYNWYDSAAKNNLLFSGPAYTTASLTANKTYFVEVSNGTCTSAALTNITVLVLTPLSAPTLVVNPVSICPGATATFNIASQQATLSYNWYTSATGGTPAFTGPQFTTAALAANATYYVEAVNAAGCTSARTTANITVTAAPSIATQGAAVCPGTGTTLTATSTDNNVTIKWYSSLTGGSSVYTGASFPTPVINAATTYYAEATNNASGCLSVNRAMSTIQLIQHLATPVVSVDAITATSVSFKWNAVTNSTGYQVSIDNGQTFSNPSSGSGGLTHTVSGLTNGQTVNIIVRATGASECQLSINSVPVTATALILTDNQIFIANGFTPNGDGRNDIVYVHSENISTLKFYVYDQWGEMLFTSTSKQSGWDGTYKGQPEPAGVYVYYVQAVMTDGKQVNKKGTITLIR